MEMKRCIYPGTFDPITKGHLDIINRALGIFDEVVVGVAISKSKSPYFSQEDRINFIKKATNSSKVKVMGYSGLLVDFAKELNIFNIIRGLRVINDFEFEAGLDYANKSMCDKIECFYLFSSNEYRFISSTIVRTILEFNGDPSNFIPEIIKNDVMDKRC